MPKRLLSPFQKFVQLESFSGILLALATFVALGWANSAYAETYDSFFNIQLGITSDLFSFSKPLIFWINDGLMTIFFFLIGLEIKREILVGELNTVKKALFPFFGALGGMLVPVLFYFILNSNPATESGWGVPMATDIAFSLAILKALGKRVPLALKIFLTAFAIVDDIAAVLVIAIFYSGDLQIDLLLYALLILGGYTVFALKVFYSKYLNIAVGLAVFVLFYNAGIHPTLAGILMAFAVPVHRAAAGFGFVEQLQVLTDKIAKHTNPTATLLTKEQIANISKLEDLTARYQSPLQHTENDLHNWVAYFIIPIFALANAGVALSSDIPLEWSLIMTLIVCLVIGKGLGITGIVLLAKKFKLAQVPESIKPLHIVGVSFIAGVGFTMSIFIATLAFLNAQEYIGSAKVGIMIGSILSGAIGATILYMAGAKYQNKEGE